MNLHYPRRALNGSLFNDHEPPIVSDEDDGKSNFALFSLHSDHLPISTDQIDIISTKKLKFASQNF